MSIERTRDAATRAALGHGADAPCFVIDRRLRVVGWSEGAERATGVSEEQALGRPCWDARAHRPISRRPPECRGCVPAGDRAGNGVGNDCVPLPVPGRPDAALVWLVGEEATVPPLVLVGTIATLLSDDVFSTGLPRALEVLRRALRADYAELFLVEPAGGDLVLAAHNGSAREAFLERDRFPPGSGYPSAVLDAGRPLVSHDLPNDRAFVRKSVCAAGVRRYECVPVRGPFGVIGALGVAWRARSAPPTASALIEPCARSIGTAIVAGLAARRDVVDRMVSGGDSVQECAQHAADAVVRAVGARGATLLLLDASMAVTQTISSGAAPPLPHGFARAEQWLWSRLREGHGITLGNDSEHLPKSFRRECSAQPPTYCLPLAVGGHLSGALFLDLGEEGPPEIPTGPLVPMLTMADEVARRLVARARPAIEVEHGPLLDLRCFGQLEVRLGGRAIPTEAFARRKALSLLRLLVLRAGNPIARDELCEHLWPGADGEAALRNRLHVTVHALRAAIEPRHAERRWLFVRNEGELYYFDMNAPHRIDLYELKRLSSLSLRARSDGRLRECLTLGEKAVSLYRGELFADEPYADWCAAERGNIEHRVLDLVRTLAQASTETGDHERAVAWLRHGLSIDPLEEDFHRDLIEILVGMGRRTEAVAQFSACETLLRERLGVSPMPETRKLVRLLLDNRSAPPRS